MFWFFSELDPFLSAIWRGDEKALRDIIHLNLHILDEPNKDGWIPLHECAFYGHVECLKILLKGEKCVSCKSVQCLRIRPKNHIVNLYYISSTAMPDTINKRTKKNQTPLYLAATHKHLSCVEYLLKKGADSNLANSQWETPLNKGTF